MRIKESANTYLPDNTNVLVMISAILMMAIMAAARSTRNAWSSINWRFDLMVNIAKPTLAMPVDDIALTIMT